MVERIADHRSAVKRCRLQICTSGGSTLADAAMFGTGLIIGVAVGPITAGVVGLVYGGTRLMGGQDAINNSFNGDWNDNLNKKIKAIYGR